MVQIEQHAQRITRQTGRKHTPRWKRLAEQHATQGYVLVIHHRQHRAWFERRRSSTTIPYHRALKIKREGIIETRDL